MITGNFLSKISKIHLSTSNGQPHIVPLFRSYSQAGATIGCIMAFLLGRFVLREQTEGLFNKFKILKAVDKAIESQGLKLVILLRLSPVVPYNVFNYVM